MDAGGVHLARMTYSAVVLGSLGSVTDRALPALRELARNGRLIVRGVDSPVGGVRVSDDTEPIAALDALVATDLTLSPP